MNSYRVGIAGFGAIGQSVAQSLNASLPGLSLAAVAVRDPQAPPAFDWREPPRFSTLADLHAHCDVVVECAPAAVFRELAEPVLRAGKKLVVLSSGAPAPRRPDRTGAPARRPDHRAVRRHPGTGRDHRRRRGRDPFGHDDHSQARARGLLGAPIWRTTTST